MRKITFLLALALLLTIAGTAGAATTADELLPSIGEKDGMLTRGEFAKMLVTAAGMKGDEPSVQILTEGGILKGYPDGELHLEQGINRLEAVSLAARSLGLTDAIVPPPGVSAPLDKNHWGYNLYAWFTRQGLVTDNPNELLTEEQGAAFLQKVFTTDPEVVSILEASQAKTSKQNQSVQTVMSGSMKMIPREGVETEGLPTSVINLEMVQEMTLPDKLHQTANMMVQAAGEEPTEMATEMYMVAGEVYQKMPDAEEGIAKWYRFPKDLLPDMEQVFKKAEQQSSVIPPELEQFLHYQLLGTTELNGETVYEVAFYGRVDDFNKFMQAALGQFGDSQQLTQSMSNAASVLKSMSYWGIEYLGTDDFLPRSADYTALVTYQEQFNGQPMPLEALQTYMKVEEYNYDADITIELPEEAVNAPVLPISQNSLETVE